MPSNPASYSPTRRSETQTACLSPHRFPAKRRQVPYAAPIRRSRIPFPAPSVPPAPDIRHLPRFRLDLKPAKQLRRIAAPAVIGRKHLKRHGFPETALYAYYTLVFPSPQ